MAIHTAAKTIKMLVYPTMSRARTPVMPSTPSCERRHVVSVEGTVGWHLQLAFPLDCRNETALIGVAGKYGGTTFTRLQYR